MHAQISQVPLYRIVLEVAVAAVHLERVVDDVVASVGGKAFGHGAIHGVFRCVLL